MKLAVVTPYYREDPAVLEQCHLSVKSQVHAATHVMVADGFPCADIDDWAADHIRLPRPHNDVGSTPRYVGAIHAFGLGYDAVAFLDADNWYHPVHLATLVELAERTGALFVSSTRTLCRLDGSVLAERCPYTQQDSFVDTSCMMLRRECIRHLHRWITMPAYAHPVSDRVFLQHIVRQGVPRAHSDIPTVYYRCGKAGVYRSLGERPPDGVAQPPDYGAIFANWIADGNPPLA